MILFVGLLVKIQSRKGLKHQSPTEPEPVCKYLTLENAVHFVMNNIVDGNYKLSLIEIMW